MPNDFTKPDPEQAHDSGQPEQPAGPSYPPPPPAPGYGDQNHHQPYVGQGGGYPAPPQVGTPYGAAPQVGKPDNYLVWAILTTLLCCLPFGIVSIVYAAKVDSAWFAGRYQEAAAASESAKKWAIAGAVCALVAVVLYIAVIVIGVLATGEAVSHVDQTTYHSGY